jgi:hypothetical protein
MTILALIVLLAQADGLALLQKGDKPGAKAEYENYLRLAPPKAKRAETARERLKSIE